MKTASSNPRILAGLRRRVKQFYDRLNRGEFDKCYNAIDPDIRTTPTAITLGQYLASAERFMAWCGQVRIRDLQVTDFRIGETTVQYHDRGFALLKLVWEDDHGGQHTFKERWVRDRRGWWYTRCTGFVVPG